MGCPLFPAVRSPTSLIVIGPPVQRLRDEFAAVGHPRRDNAVTIPTFNSYPRPYLSPQRAQRIFRVFVNIREGRTYEGLLNC